MKENINLLALIIFFNVIALGDCDCVKTKQTISSTNQTCVMGDCVDGKCVCFVGWTDTFCDQCHGRVLLNNTSGYISDGWGDYKANKNCTWLISPSNKSSKLILKIEEFITECGWDYLYVFDGDSIYSPLLASLNGYMYKQGEKVETLKQPPEIESTSGKVFITFYSDRAKTSSGFNISYSTSGCIKNCSNSGSCDEDGNCNCWEGFSGQWCEHEMCPHNCSAAQGFGLCNITNNSRSCQCISSKQGPDCSVSSSQGWWTSESLAGLNGASSATVVLNNNIWKSGGLQFGSKTNNLTLSSYNVTNKSWKSEQGTGPLPTMRYGHSMVTWNNSLIVFGGKSTTTERSLCDSWIYDVIQSRWEKLEGDSNQIQNLTDLKSANISSKLCLTGHTSLVVTSSNGSDVMLVLFGLHPELDLSNRVLEYQILKKNWEEPHVNESPYSGLFGHATAYDVTSQLVYIYGGYKRPLGGRELVLTNSLMSYDVINRRFTAIEATGSVVPLPRFLHSIQLLDGVLYVFGGDARTAENQRGCYVTNFEAFSISYQSWKYVDSIEYPGHAARYGHTSAVVHSRLYIIGGYDGQMIDDVIIYQPARCHVLMSRDECEASWTNWTLSCHWTDTNGCEPVTTNLSIRPTNLSCSLLSCADCLVAGCHFCEVQCVHNSSSHTCRYQPIPSVDKCPNDDVIECSKAHTCHQCLAKSRRCKWSMSGCVTNSNATNWVCPTESCTSHVTCDECSDDLRCMWCVNHQRCFDSTSYLIQYPYGQCLQWHSRETNNLSTSMCPIHECSLFLDSEHCHSNPGCGWCDLNQGNGLGVCIEGSASGPLDSITHQLNMSLCPANQWYFVGLPPCPCNGHSDCGSGEGVCEPCSNNTVGQFCQTCAPHFFGEARNGGNCKPCTCEDRADNCDPVTGACYCQTKGVVGDHCDACLNTQTRYLGNASHPNGTCYYPIVLGYQYTFTIEGSVDAYITKINFIYLPTKSQDVTLKIDQPDDDQLIQARLAVGDGVMPEETTITRFENKTSVSFAVSSSQISINSSLRIYISQLHPPLIIRVSLTPRQEVLLTILLVLFSSFLVLLIIGAVGWRLRIWMQLRRIRQNRRVEMQQMAARPSFTLNLLFDPPQKKWPLEVALPSPLCVQQCSDARLSLVTVLLWLPATPYPPKGQSALACGTALTSSPRTRQQVTSLIDQNSRQDEMGQMTSRSSYDNHAMHTRA